ncbi:DUF924 family protein [Henriciella aquimarina]|uniref:DUF924 family protein n=1 Tax=Henriciella aquimarina TaxID=545261 RepID=UPI000A063089|nr:DUF924 family protein [Henriciella aquimarina]
MTVTPETVLDYWIGDTAASPETLEEKGKLWFQKSFETDQEIAKTFVSTLADLAAGLAQDWAARGPRERLAAIIVLDQFSRNIFRDHRFAFKHDPLALALAKEGVGRREDEGLSESERVFLYLPYEHSEDLADQRRSVELFDKLVADAREGFKPFAENVRSYAVAHLEVIEEFGRFPHRNSVLRRASTREEQAYLSQPGAGF